MLFFLRLWNRTTQRQQRICVICQASKDVSEFPRHKNNKDGLDTRCRACKTTMNTHVRRLRKVAPPRPATCECCGAVPKKWVLDHNHKTGKFRGWICDPCNLGLGKLGDSTEGLERAIEYLRRTDNG